MLNKLGDFAPLREKKFISRNAAEAQNLTGSRPEKANNKSAAL
jgi:hypothetical protein